MRILLPVALASSTLIACAVPGSEPVPTESSSTTATAIVVVERSAGPGDAVRGDAVSARFVRVRQGAVDEGALHIAGVAADIPAPGTCTVPTEAAPAFQNRVVELLDVGPVTISSSTETKSTLLLPRSMPDPAGVVSGVFYSSRSADVFVPSSSVVLRASGGADLAEGFSVGVTAPRDVADIRVVGSANGLDVSWDATESDAHDLVYVDVLSPAPRVVVARCVAADVAGHLFVPQGLDEGQVAVHRLHRESFRAKGIEPGEVRFDVARVVTFRR